MIKLYKGDCLEIMKDIPDKSIDMILCDLPYGTTACKWDTIIPFEPLWEEYNRIIKDNGAIVLFGSEPFSSKLRVSNMKNYKYDWKWDKVVGSNFVNAKYMPLKVYEDIIVFYKQRPTYNPQMVERNSKNGRVSGNSKQIKNNINGIKQIKSNTNGKKKYPTNKIEINRLEKELNSKYIMHPTQKPVVLLEYLIKTYTNEGETVLDNCMGSGSTGVACKRTNRSFIGIELDDNYFEIAKKRIEEE
jgi:site-specific DNA-methyltransferase (adenine-specific)